MASAEEGKTSPDKKDILSGYTVNQKVLRLVNGRDLRIMIYVSSDWHGWPLEKIKQLLKRAGFGEEDFLFVLGDVIDRGEDGVALLRWMTAQPNVQLILGNHEAMLLACEFIFKEVTEESLANVTSENLDMLYTWRKNGGDTTLSGLQQLLRENPDELEGILEYLHDAPLFETIEINKRQFVLVHSGIENFVADKPLEEYSPDVFLWARPSLQTQYYKNATVILGHTPTFYYGESYKGKAVFADTWICIDTGAAAGISPMLLRLDDMKAFI